MVRFRLDQLVHLHLVVLEARQHQLVLVGQFHRDLLDQEHLVVPEVLNYLLHLDLMARLGLGVLQLRLQSVL